MASHQADLETESEVRRQMGAKKASMGGTLLKYAKSGGSKVLKSSTKSRRFTPNTLADFDNGSSDSLSRALAEAELGVLSPTTSTTAMTSEPPTKGPLGTIKGRISRAFLKTVSITRQVTGESKLSVEETSTVQSELQEDTYEDNNAGTNNQRTSLSKAPIDEPTEQLDEPQEEEEPIEIAPTTVVTLNIGGQAFSTTYGTLTQESDSLLAKMVRDGTNRVIDVDGQYFVDRDGKHFGTILNFMRSGACTFPEPGSLEWEEMMNEVTYYNLKSLQTEMNQVEMQSFARAQRLEFLKQKLNGDEELIMTTQAKEIEKMRVELQRLQFENRKFSVLAKHKASKDFAYNLLVVGVTGTGKSSSLNTLLDSQDNVVSGAQAQGTRGTTMRDGIIDDRHFISYIDTQGLGADTSVSDKMLLSHIMMSTESVLQMRIINNILISFDLSARATPATMANQLTLMELFYELRGSSFLCLTKWNTNSVLSEWNKSLRKWVRRWRRAKTIEEIDEDPPSYETMYREYSTYLLDNLAHNVDDAGAFAKMSLVLAYFEARVIWMFNLDEMEQLDKEEGELPPHIDRMYRFYRQLALQTLHRGSSVIHVSDLVFLKSSEDTMMSVAGRLVDARDKRIEMIQRVASDEENFANFKTMFGAMTRSFASKVASCSYEPTDQYLSNIARLAGNVYEERDSVSKEVCTIS